MSYHLPDQPRSKTGADLFEFNNFDYLVIVNYFSHFWEIDRLQAIITSTVIF